MYPKAGVKSRTLIGNWTSRFRFRFFSSLNRGGYNSESRRQACGCCTLPFGGMGGRVTVCHIGCPRQIFPHYAAYCRINRRLDYAWRSPKCSAIHPQLLNWPVTYRDSCPHSLRLFAWPENYLSQYKNTGGKGTSFPISIALLTAFEMAHGETSRCRAGSLIVGGY